MGQRIDLDLSLHWNIDTGASEEWPALLARATNVVAELEESVAQASVGDLHHFADIVGALESIESTLKRMRACYRKE